MLENQLNLLDKLFEEWKKTDSQEFGSDSHFAFSKDGIICSDEYGKNNPKLLFIAKEPNAGGVYNSDIFSMKSYTDFLIILAPLRKCRNCLEYQAFPAFCVSEDTPHIMAYRSLIWRSKVVKP